MIQKSSMEIAGVVIHHGCPIRTNNGGGHYHKQNHGIIAQRHKQICIHLLITRWWYDFSCTNLPGFAERTRELSIAGY